jgi:hypothetical protein
MPVSVCQLEQTRRLRDSSRMMRISVVTNAEPSFTCHVIPAYRCAKPDRYLSGNI